MQPFEISQTVSDQAAVEFSTLAAQLQKTVRVQRVLMDCPEMAFLFRPFLVPPAPGESDSYMLAPMRADTAPMAHMIRALLEEPLEG